MLARLPSSLAVLGALALGLGHAPAAAQRLPPRPAEIQDSTPAWPGGAALPAPPVATSGSGGSRPHYSGMVAGGLLGGAVGGGTVYLLARGSNRDIGADVVAAMVGGAVAIPLGVHLGNGGRGNPGVTVAAALGAGVGTLLLGAAGIQPVELFVLGAPAAALVAAVFAEGRTTP